MTHTPGPWLVGQFDDGAYGVGRDPEFVGLAKMIAAPGPHNRANATLMAAAPQMLTALKAAWFAIDPDTHPDQNRMVRAAIDAAEGQP